MELKKETTVSALTTDGRKIEPGDTVVFNFDNRCCTGVYLGLSDKSVLRFRGKIAGTDVTFNVMPRSIKEIYLAEVKVDAGFMNPPAESESEE